MSEKTTPCANYRVNGCKGIVYDRGNILCKLCTQNREYLLKSKQNRREQEFLELEKHYIQKYENIIYKLEKEKNSFTCQVEKLKKEHETEISLLTKKFSTTLSEHVQSLKKEREQLEHENKLLQLKLQEVSLISPKSIDINENLVKLNDALIKQNKKLLK